MTERTTYTEHKLTQSQLTLLSQITNGRQRKHYGPTLRILARRGLIWHERHADVGQIDIMPGLGYLPTELGVDALRAARREGW